MNKSEIQQQLSEMEIRALDKFCDYNNIAVKDYINTDIMDILEYQTYVELYHQAFGDCFECEQYPCDEGCPYKVNKESEQENA
jgi:hypothetical protein